MCVARDISCAYCNVIDLCEITVRWAAGGKMDGEFRNVQNWPKRTVVEWVGKKAQYPKRERVECTRDGRENATLFAGHMKRLLTDGTYNTLWGVDKP